MRPANQMWTVLLTVLALLSFSTLAVLPESWHQDGPGGECAVCHARHVPFLQLAIVPHTLALSSAGWHIEADQSGSVTLAVPLSTPSRAPPA